MKKRCAAAHYAAAQLSLQGYHVFSPLTHNEILIDLAPQIPGEHWMQFDLAILAICESLFILKVEGSESLKAFKEKSFLRRKKAFLSKKSSLSRKSIDGCGISWRLNDPFREYVLQCRTRVSHGIRSVVIYAEKRSFGYRR